MSDEQTKEVQLGDRKVSVSRFTTFKVIEAMAIVETVMSEVPMLGEKISTFSHEFRQTHSRKISRATAELRYPPEEVARVSEKAWEAGGQAIEVPATPGPLDIAAHVFPDVFKVARTQVLRLLALVIAPNSELRSADDDGSLNELLDRHAKALLHEDAGELTDLLAATAEVLREQFEGRAEALGPLGRLLGIRSGQESPEEKAEQAEKDRQPVTVTAPDSPESDSKPASSTDSLEPTDGIAGSRSTESPSARPVASGG